MTKEKVYFYYEAPEDKMKSSFREYYETHKDRMKALKCKPSAQFAYNYTINVLSKCSNIISHRSSVFEGRHNDHQSSKVATHNDPRSSKVDTSIIDPRRSTHRSSIFESRHVDL